MNQTTRVLGLQLIPKLYFAQGSGFRALDLSSLLPRARSPQPRAKEVLGYALVFGLLLGWHAAICEATTMAGKRAPGFTLTDTMGQKRSLTEFKGTLVVLEWFNHDCPFTRKHYGSGNMQRLQHKYTQQGVVWLSINSSASGKQGHMTPAQANQLTKEEGAAPTAVLLDPSGKVGRLYGAKTTPHLFIINPEGVVMYAGAIDDKPSANPADIPTATNYVQRALDEALAGKPVSIPTTKPYGCSIKY